MHSRLSYLLATLPLVTASPFAIPIPSRRAVTALDQAAFEEAHQPDPTATKALANTQIKTSDGRCLFVDELSGDFRANLLPIQVADCGSTDGQGWDVITSGVHNNVAGQALIVSSLTNGCLNFDPRRAAGNQVLIFSCGGRADGGGLVTDSQLFAFDGGAGPLALTPKNEAASCLVVSGDVVDVATCDANDVSQSFTFGDASETAPAPTEPEEPVATATDVAPTPGSEDTAPAQPQPTAPPAEAPAGGIANPTEEVPVSRAGGTLVPTAAAESHEFDDTATRAFTGASIQAPNGQCLFIDPTAGDFRQNLIPVSLVECAGTPNEKFDIITAGKHNDAQGSALVVSSLMNGCISFDSRRPAGDTVTIFSCGGRAAGEGATNNGQLVPFTGGTDLVLAPESERNATCLIPGAGRLDSAPCANDASQVFTILA